MSFTFEKLQKTYLIMFFALDIFEKCKITVFDSLFPGKKTIFANHRIPSVV